MSFCISFSLGQSLLLQSANSGLPFQKVSSNFFFSYLLSFICLTSIFFFNFYFCFQTTSFLDAYMVSFFKISNLLFLLYCSIFHLALFDFSRFYIQSSFFFLYCGKISCCLLPSIQSFPRYYFSCITLKYTQSLCSDSGGVVAVVQWVSHIWLFVTLWTAARQASLSFTVSLSLFKVMSIESVMPSNHLILCRPLLLPPSIFSSIRVFSNGSVLHIRWPKCWTLISLGHHCILPLYSKVHFLECI